MPRKPPKKKPTSGRSGVVRLPDTTIEIDFVILADHAQAAQGKLNLIGGGWNIHNANQYPSQLPFGIGIGVLVPWSQTNRRHDLTFTIKSSEGPELIRGGGQFEMGREAGMPAGMTQRAIVAINGQLQVPDPGTYEVIVSAGRSEKRVVFEAMPVRATGQVTQR